MTFEGKHADEKILHFCRPSGYQTFYEILKIIIPVLLIIFISIVLALYNVLSIGLMSGFIVILILFSTFTVIYKMYRAKNNFLFITSKRILFH